MTATAPTPEQLAAYIAMIRERLASGYYDQFETDEPELSLGRQRALARAAGRI